MLTRFLSKRMLLVVVTLAIAGGLVSSALETEGPNHQVATHHCIVCCTTCHVADTAKTPTAPQPRLSQENVPLIESLMLYQQAVIRLPDPPPKFLA